MTMLRAVAALLVLALVGGCASEDGEVASAAITAAVTAPPVEEATDTDAGVLGSSEAVMDAGRLRLRLEQLLGEHVFLVGGAAAGHAEGQATQDALEVVADNTQRLTEAIALVYGEVGARAFASLWSQHVAFFLDHARATATGATEDVTEAEGHLSHYEQGFGSFTATATGGELPADAVAQLLGVHVADVNGYVAARLAADPHAGVLALTSGHDHAADIGAALAGAIAGQGPEAFPGGVDDERTVMAAEVARAFAGHLAVRSAGPDAAPEAAAAAADRIDAALRAAATDSTAAVRAWQRLVGEGDADGRDDTTADELAVAADELAVALGVPGLGATVTALAAAPDGDSTHPDPTHPDPTHPDLIAAHRAAYELADAWLG